MNRPRGLFLVTGPTGSGKSTTLASLVNYLNETVDHATLALENDSENAHCHKWYAIAIGSLSDHVPKRHVETVLDFLNDAYAGEPFRTSPVDRATISIIADKTVDALDRYGARARW